MKKKKKPEIRFEGFTDDWEQRKLKDVYGSIGNAFVGTATPYYVEHGHFYLESNNIKDGKINHNSEIFINDEFYEKQKEKWLHTGDIVMVQSGHVGHAAVIPEELDNTAAHALIMFKNPKEKIEPYFLNYEYQTDKAKKKIENITTGNTIKHILASDMQEFEVDVPKCKEQKVIASYFCKLDHLITLHQRKYEKLKNLKKSMLKKMFPQKGCKVPGIRFSGFTDDWEQRKLEDEAIEMLAGGDIDKSRVVESGKYPIYANALTNDSIVGYYDDYYRVKAPAVTVTGRGDVGHAQARTVDFTPVVRLLAIRSEHDAYFLENAINNHGVIVESTGVPQLTVPQLGNYMIQFPKTIEEETKIGEYFDNLDHLITLHQRELEKLKNIKKTLLEKMF